jgi:hypothetical protein
LLAAFLFGPLAAIAGAELQVECGVGGFVKQQQWFAVRVTGCPPGTPIEASVLQKESYPRPRERLLFRASCVSPADTNVAAALLCQYPQNLYGEATLRVETFPARGKGERRETRIKPLQPHDTVVLILSRTPHSFNLLGSIHLPRRGVVCVVPSSRNRFPLSRREMAGVDVVILDGLDEALSDEQHAALLQWIAGGGTAIFTAKAMLAERTGDSRRLPANFTLHDATPARRPSPALARLLTTTGRYVQSAEIYPLSASARSLVVYDPSDGSGGNGSTPAPSCLVGASDIGLGRVIALGFEWESLDLTDRGFEQNVRQELWSGILALERNMGTGRTSNEVVTPEEARTRFLLLYIAIFLAVYVLALGPLNALLLRARGKIEWSVVTVPIGAVLFSAAAFAIGLILRTDQTLHREFSAGLAAGDQCFTMGTVGILAPDRQPYTVTMASRTGRVAPSDAHRWSPSPRRMQDIETYAFTPECSLSNLRIGMWSMRYLETDDVIPLGGQVAATARCDTNALIGTVANGLPFDLRDAWLVSRWGRSRIGDIAACSSTNFTIAAQPPDRSHRERCRNCRRVHSHASPWGSHDETDGCQLPKETERQLTSIRHSFGGLFEKPVVVAWQDASDALVRLDRPDAIRQGHRMLAIPVTVEFPGPDLRVPAGLVKARGNQTVPGLVPSAFVEDIRFSPATRAFAAASGQTAVPPDELDIAMYRVANHATFAPDEYVVHAPDNQSETQYDFYLPFRESDVETHRISLYWDTGEADPEGNRCVSRLAAYDWNATNWVELARLRDGEGALDLPDPDRFLERGSSLVRLACAPDRKPGEEQYAHYPIHYIELAYEGRRTGK